MKKKLVEGVWQCTRPGLNYGHGRDSGCLLGDLYYVDLFIHTADVAYSFVKRIVVVTESLIWLAKKTSSFNPMEISTGMFSRRLALILEFLVADQCCRIGFDF